MFARLDRHHVRHVVIGGLIAACMISVVAPTSLAQTTSAAGPRFEFVEGNSVVWPEGLEQWDNEIGRTVTLFGKLEDTGTQNFFYTFSFDGEKARQRFCRLGRRIFQKPRSSIWTKITGRILEGLILDPDSFEELHEYDSKIARAVEISCAWVREHRLAVDLNGYKKLERFRQAFPELAGLDFNRTDFQASRHAVFVDFEKGIVGTHCGQNLLRETSNRGDYLSILAIFDMAEDQVVKVQVVNTGYFHE